MLVDVLLQMLRLLPLIFSSRTLRSHGRVQIFNQLDISRVSATHQHISQLVSLKIYTSRTGMSADLPLIWDFCRWSPKTVAFLETGFFVRNYHL